MKVLYTAIFLTFTIASCGDGENNPESNEGADIYEKNCVSCHGPDGDMGAGGAKPLSQSGLSFEEMVSVVTHGSGRMMPYKDMLTDKQIEEVVTYIETFKN